MVSDTSSLGNVTIPVVPVAQVMKSVTADVQADPVDSPSISKRAESVQCKQQKYLVNVFPAYAYNGLVNDDFVNDESYRLAANQATRNIPSGYTLQFAEVKGSYGGSSSFLGATEFTNYDSAACAAKCDARSDCISYNIFFERDPLEDQTSDTCSTEGATVIKCGLWGVPLVPSSADEFASHVNDGQWRRNFRVSITGSNGYSKLSLPPVNGYSGQALRGSIQGHYYMGVKSYTINPDVKAPVPEGTVPSFNPSYCAAACEAQTAYNMRHPGTSGLACKYFNSYILSKTVNSTPDGDMLACALYSLAPSQYPDGVVDQTKIATNYGQTRGAAKYTVSSSYGYTKN